MVDPTLREIYPARAGNGEMLPVWTWHPDAGLESAKEDGDGAAKTTSNQGVAAAGTAETFSPLEPGVWTIGVYPDSDLADGIPANCYMRWGTQAEVDGSGEAADTDDWLQDFSRQQVVTFNVNQDKPFLSLLVPSGAGDVRVFMRKGR